ncbi:MAG: hypothetical protein IJC27_10830, partial [Lentisphaeria bacterium]|nr:hypothetical protein [Lentisphaeria bacterium]
MPEGGLPFLKKSCLSEKSFQVIRTADIFISTIHIGTASAICRKKFRKTGIIYCRRWESTVREQIENAKFS